jgi:drug/metabolite transporter (DMT)-like permease
MARAAGAPQLLGGLSSEATGLLITSIGVAVLSLEGLLIRLIDVDAWTILSVRGMLGAVGLLVFFAFVERAGWRAHLTSMGMAGLAAMVMFAIDNLAFMYSITHTSVANTLLMISLTPIFATLLSRLVLREAVPTRTWLAVAGATIGMVVILSGSLAKGDFLGNVAGLVAAMSIGGTLVVLRGNPSLNLIPAMAFGAGLAALIALPASALGSADASDWALLAVLGLLVVPIAFGSIALGPRLMPAAEVALLLLVETPLGAFWVWIAVGESPTAATAAGGLILLAVLGGHSVASLRSLKGGIQRQVGHGPGDTASQRQPTASRSDDSGDVRRR